MSNYDYSIDASDSTISVSLVPEGTGACYEMVYYKLENMLVQKAQDMLDGTLQVGDALFIEFRIHKDEEIN